MQKPRGSRIRTSWRTAQRRPVIGIAVLQFQDVELHGALLDASEFGARLTSRAAYHIPAQFNIRLGRTNNRVRTARMVWRRGSQFGVQLG